MSEQQVQTLKKPIYKKWWFWLIVIIIIIAIASKGKDEKSAATSADKSVESSKSGESTSKDDSKKSNSTVYKLNEEAKAKNLSFVVSEVKSDTKIGKNEYLQKKTDNQFLILKITVTNNDKDARTIDTAMFKLKDSAGKEYSAMSDADLYVNGDGTTFFLAKVNPGLNKTGNIVFEIPKNLKGLKLECASGVGFQAGTTATIDLGI